ncbi:MAG: phage baseplate assembly protein V [Proteobacteria bacterium]|nr:phage baseplate assembly protein V [Pseudomonadota bacterium]
MRPLKPFYDISGFFAQQIQTAETEAAKIYEPLIGVVTDNKDPSKLGRVKVALQVLSAKDATWWCPLVMLGAGKNRGWFFIPEVGDEVLVMFEHGDADRPVIVGALWGGKDKPSDKNPGGVPRRLIKSRGGSKILFDDENKKIVIEDGAGKGRITFDASANKVIIEALVGDVALQAPTGTMKIVAKSVDIQAGQNVEIHAGSNMAWGVGQKATIKGANVTIAGSKVNENCGVAQSPPKGSATPADVADPYGS